jgi:hypothetical protein
MEENIHDGCNRCPHCILVAKFVDLFNAWDEYGDEAMQGIMEDDLNKEDVGDLKEILFKLSQLLAQFVSTVATKEHLIRKEEMKSRQDQLNRHMNN